MIDYKQCDKNQLKYEFERLAGLSKYKPTMGYFNIFTKLPDFLTPGEQILCINGGLLKYEIWLIVPTNTRLILINKRSGFLSKKVEMTSLDYENITSVDSTSGLAGGKITIVTAGKKYEITRLQQNSVNPVVNAILQTKKALASPGTVAAPAAAPADNDDIISKLERLGELKDKGILTDEEFKIQKEKLINQ